MTTLVEQIKNAMDEASEAWAAGTLNQPWECPAEVMIIAALKAMREPTPTMIEAFRERPVFCSCDECAKTVFGDMVDVAIAEVKDEG